MKKKYAFKAPTLQTLLFACVLLLGSFIAKSQCKMGSYYKSASINPNGVISTITTCNWAGEYSTIANAVSGQTLQFTSSVATDFITITSGSSTGPVIAYGTTPLSFINTYTGTIYAHWATDAACGTQDACRETTVQCASCATTPATGLNFDGTDDYVSVPNNASQNVGTNFTLELWLKPYWGNAGFSALLDKRDYNNNSNFSMAVYNGTTPTIYINNGTTILNEWGLNNPITINQWNHYAVTYDGATLKIYINGVLNKTASVVITNPLLNEPLFIGSTLGLGEFFHGTLDDVRIWNYARSATEIANNKDCELTGSESGLQAYYNCNNGIVNANNTGLSTITDQTSNNNDGSLTNFALTGATSNWAEGAAISGSCAPIMCAATATFKLDGLKSFWKNGGANDDAMFYHGVTQWKRVHAKVSGGVGPYTYTWSNSKGYTLRNQSGNQVQLFEPLGPSYMVCEITDQGAGCTFKDSVFVDWTDEFYCGDASDYWKLKVCQSGSSACMKWNDAKALLKSGVASLGDCGSTPLKTGAPAAITGIKLYPNPANSIINLASTFEYSSAATLDIVDLSGKVLQSNSVNISEGVFEYNINIDNLTNGMYMIRMSTNREVIVERFQVVK